jgi:hypothetical protein
VDFRQDRPARDYGYSRFCLGNAYTEARPDTVAVAETVAATYEELRSATLAWTDAFAASTLPPDTASRMAALVADVRSPTVFRSADGTVLGFEGLSGESTAMWSGRHGGACPLNCTHVWHYEQTMSQLLPELADRAALPPELWDGPIGGPEQPALDGMLGAVLKTYREVRQGAGLEWLERRWSNITRLLHHVRATWDPEGTGVLRGIQQSKHDSDLRGTEFPGDPGHPATGEDDCVGHCVSLPPRGGAGHIT